MTDTPRTIDVVVHCYGELYRQLLGYQISSLMFSTTRLEHDVNIHIYYDIGDMEIAMGLCDASRRLDRSSSLRLHATGQPREDALERNIGRNISALSCRADWIWFADCDYLFGPGSLDALAALDPHDYRLVFPRHVYKSTYFFDALPGGVDPIRTIFRSGTTEGFTQERIPRAIGGLQIVPGHIAREYGYLPEAKWQKPVEGDKFQDTKGDRAFRQSLGTQGTPVNIPNVYRLRHRIPEYSARHHLLPMEEA